MAVRRNRESQSLPTNGYSHLPMPESRSSGATRSERAAAEVVQATLSQ